MERWIGKVAIVTGASGGIGAAIVKVLVQKGLTVVGLARRKDKILELREEVSKETGKLYAFECDLTKEEDIIAAFNWIDEKFGGVDILVNNAGVIRISTLTAGSTEEWKETFDLNILAVCICTREAYKLMENRERGHIVNICSIAGHRIPNVIPSFLNVYPASKHALRAISDTLRVECIRNKKRIKVTNLSPGSVNGTGIISGIESLIEKLSETDLAELSRHSVSLKPDDIASAVSYVLDTPPHVEIREMIIEPLGSIC